jgi:hypothetical protein
MATSSLTTLYFKEHTIISFNMRSLLSETQSPPENRINGGALALITALYLAQIRTTTSRKKCLTTLPILEAWSSAGYGVTVFTIWCTTVYDVVAAVVCDDLVL